MTAGPETTWFDDARFGLFIHWDHASQRGWELSWPLVGGVFSLPYCQSVSVDDYHALAVTFDPTAWNPAELATRAKAAGMRYMVFTTRHHSGFAMYDSNVSNHTVMHTPSGRDLTRETVDAFRAEGLRIGLYYSLSDWFHPDYPAFTEEMKPYVFGTSPALPSEEQAERFRSYLLAQLEELMTGYGLIDVVWFDGGWERPAEWWHPRGDRDAAAQASTRDPHQRPPSRTRRLRNHRAVRPSEQSGWAVGIVSDDERELGLER